MNLRKRLRQTFADKKNIKKWEGNPHGYRVEGMSDVNDVVYLLTFASYVDVNKHEVCQQLEYGSQEFSQSG